MFKKIRRWWNSWSFRGVYERSIEVVLFIPVVFRVVRWDYTSLLIIMEHWLHRMQKVHESDQALQRTKQILVARNLVKRMSNDYEDAFYEEHDKRWGEAKYWFVRCPDQSGMSEMHSKRAGVLTKKDKELERKEMKKIFDHAEYLYQQDCDLLTKLFKKHLRAWWT